MSRWAGGNHRLQTNYESAGEQDSGTMLCTGRRCPHPALGNQNWGYPQPPWAQGQETHSRHLWQRATTKNVMAVLEGLGRDEGGFASMPFFSTAGRASCNSPRGEQPGGWEAKAVNELT